MDNKSRNTSIGAGILAAVVGFGAWIGHEAGLLSHDAEPLVAGAGHVAGGGGGDAIAQAVKDGASYFRTLRSGSSDDEKMAAAACTVMNSYVGATPTQNQFVDGIYSQLGVEQGSFEGLLISSKVNQAANYLVVAQSNGGLAVNYARYCRP
jgi:hypothetical protein